MQLVIYVCNIFFIIKDERNSVDSFIEAQWNSKKLHIYITNSLSRRLSHKGNNSNSLPYSHWSISAISQITATTTSQNNIVNSNHTNMCKGNYKQLTRKIHYNNKLIKYLEYKTPNISCFGMCAWKKQYVMSEWWR